VLSSLEESGEGSLGELLNRGDEENRTVRVVISTLPAGAKFVLPEWIYDGLQEKPVVFDVNYKPYYTDLLRQAERMNCNFVRGSEMLWEQGVGQFELWTERTAPYRVMKEVVLSNCVQAVSHV
jgi:shikimate 5-dehydrogenase